jgi:enoyl-CoA hydratase/carnithine racemase
MAGIPLIARINGACVAGGMGLMALCDLAIAAEHARFGLPEVKVGVFPMQVLVFLRSMLQARHINELCLTGELITSGRALEMGLINQVVPAASLDEAVEVLLVKLRAASPMAVRRGKQVIFAMEMMAFSEALAFAEAQIALASASDDAREGLAAFNERRPPSWLPRKEEDKRG